MSSRTFDVGPVAAFRSGEPRRVDANGRALVVVRNGDEFYAIRDVCPHQGARLSDGDVSGATAPCKPGEEIALERFGEIIVCPWHGWEFDLKTGRSLVAPEKARTRPYAARAEGGRVLIDM